MPVASGLYYFAHEAEDASKKRPPVILIHGAGGIHLTWAPQIRRLEGERIFAPDLPGHGQSEGMARHTIEEYAEDVVNFMKAVKIKSAVMVGVSMGGAIALTLALKHPKKITALALIGCGVKLRVAPAILDALANPNQFETAAQTINQNCFSVNAAQNLLDLSLRHLLQMRPSALYADFLACNEFNISERLSKITQPTLVLCGSEDKMTPPKYSEGLMSELPHAQLQIIQDAGHLAMLEQPDLTASLLKRFLDEIPASSEG